jgi:hypothetical protein
MAIERGNTNPIIATAETAKMTLGTEIYITTNLKTSAEVLKATQGTN